jgi:hypothetical protein
VEGIGEAALGLVAGLAVFDGAQFGWLLVGPEPEDPGELVEGSLMGVFCLWVSALEVFGADEVFALGVDKLSEVGDAEVGVEGLQERAGGELMVHKVVEV